MKPLPEHEFYFEPAPPEHVSREKRKARELRLSQWWKNQLARGRCYYCGEHLHPRNLTMDHVVPIIRGGRSSRANTVPCCKPCNNAKQYMVPSEWSKHLQRLREKAKKI